MDCAARAQACARDSARGRRGSRFVDADLGGLRQALEQLRCGKVVAIAADRDLARTGHAVPFFGERTTLPSGPIALARRTGATVLPSFVRRLGPGHYTMQFEAPIDLTHLDPPRPAPGVKALLHGWRIVLFEQVQFAPGREALLPASGELLRQVAQILKDNPQIRFVQIEGHTDDSGDPTGNERLSQRRAEKVRDFLVGAGVAANRLEPRGFGPKRPLDTNDTPEGRARNRRVEFVILETGK